MKLRSLRTVAVAAVALSVSFIVVPPGWAQGKQAIDAAEGRNCATPEPTPVEMEQVFEAVNQWMKAHPNLMQATGGQIKVAWHVIYSGSTGNIPQSQIDAQILELNRSYAGYYGGFNTGYTFVLASVDRTSNRRWFGMTPGSNAENQAKSALAIDPAHRLNLYSCKPGQNLLGWAVFPWSYAENNYRHGVVIHYGSVPGGYLAPYNLGGTADHEVGHYLGLYHTFQGGCTGSGDYVSDTPAEATPTSGCPEGKNTCTSPGLDPIHNYMDYSTDACYTEFTSGQDVRMDGVVTTYKPSLLNAALVAEDLGGKSADPLTGSLESRPSLRGAFPTPFRTESVMRFYLPRRGAASLRIYNVAGQLVETLAEGELEAGEHTAVFRPRDLPSGMYFASFRTADATQNRTIIYLK
jgi:hypothetical protein